MTDPAKRHIRFLPVATTGRGRRTWESRGLIRRSVWLWLTVCVLFLATILFMVAFLANGWGRLIVHQPVQPVMNGSAIQGMVVTNTTYTYALYEKYWDFGLWQTCRNDGFCLGTRWPPFYRATRVFCVLGLFGLVLSAAWMLGHVMENLLEYHPCTNISFIILMGSTGIFLLIAVCCFGTQWPEEFKGDFQGVQTYLNYCFYLAVDVVILVFVAVGLTTVDFVLLMRRIRLRSRDEWVTAEEILGTEDNTNV